MLIWLVRKHRSFFEKSYLSNDYFSKNFDKYVKKEGENDPHRVFAPVIDHEETLKLPIMDCFFTRYAYHNFARWTNRLMLYLGARQE